MSGNRYASWKNFIPFRKKQWKEIKQVIAVDILQADNEPIETIGHNAVAGFTYFMTFLAFLFPCITGFGLYAAMSKAWFPKLFAWIVPLMGGDFAVRQWHHAFMWFFILFALVHVYIVFYHDYVEGRGEISSMGSGWKFIEKEYHPILKGQKDHQEMSDASRPPAVLGVGNLLMGDEGAGIAAVRRLEQNGFGARAELVDGGTGGFHLLGLFRDRQQLILIDAADDGSRPGRFRSFNRAMPAIFPPR